MPAACIGVEEVRWAVAAFAGRLPSSFFLPLSSDFSCRISDAVSTWSCALGDWPDRYCEPAMPAAASVTADAAMIIVRFMIFRF
ncbi:hypothetical protein NXW53_19930 [Bacteroides ovatus]|nr:hypothetical protein [Bacteroides ovatus]